MIVDGTKIDGIGNVISLLLIDTYGADSLRYYLLEVKLRLVMMVTSHCLLSLQKINADFIP